MKTVLKFGLLFVNITVFVLLSALVIYVLWFYFGKSYVAGPPVGGDYYNALTYLNFLTKHPTLPTNGWLPFWHEGTPLMGGYPFLSFYLTKPLTSYFDIYNSLNYFSFASLSLFFVFSLALFRQVSKNWFVSFCLVAILLATKATYFQLTIGGNITAAAAQWYLPAVLFFIFRYAESQKPRDLLFAAVLAGFSLLQHAPSSILLILIPSIIVLIISPRKSQSFLIRLKALSVFILVSSLIGSIGLYTVFLQTFSGSGADKCISKECWGDYPTHLTRWLTPLSPTATIFSLILLIFTIFNRKKINYWLLLPPVAGFIFYLSYSAAAYFKQINVMANVLFPTRTFWAANLFLLLIAASAFNLFQKSVPKFSQSVAAIFCLVFLMVIIQKPPQIPKDFTATFPQFVESYIHPKFKSRSLAEVLPEWVLENDPNWRIDINNSGLNQWFYLLSETPITTGYSNRPSQVHQDWQYYLQTSTRRIPSGLENELTKNKSLFLIDAFGIGVLEMSQSSYPSVITSDQEIVPPPKETDLFWRKISAEFSSPIVSAVATSPILFIGSDSGYNYFIRSIAMTNLNSKIMIPIKGPTSVNDVSAQQLNNFDTLILYQTESLDLEKLSDFTKNGGSIFIDTGSISKFPKKKLPDVFPMDSLISKQSEDETNYQLTASNLAQNVDISKFSKLSYQNGPWKYSTTRILRNWANPVLSFNNQPLVIQGNLGQGKIVWSGLNLPFHIVENDNFEEAKFFKNILMSLTQPPEEKPLEFNVERRKPGEIIISGNNITGIYFKENYDSGWRANINGRKLKVYKAGLDFMYIPLPHLSNPVNIKLIYSGNLITWALFWLTITSTIVVLSVILFPGLTGKIFAKITKKLTIFLEEE